jgi:hypothetical protein
MKDISALLNCLASLPRRATGSGAGPSSDSAVSYIHWCMVQSNYMSSTGQTNFAYNEQPLFSPPFEDHLKQTKALVLPGL